MTIISCGCGWKNVVGPGGCAAGSGGEARAGVCRGDGKL